MMSELSQKEKAFDSDTVAKLLRKASDYKKSSASYDKRVLIEIYGFALGLSNSIGDLPVKQEIQGKILKTITSFIQDDLRVGKTFELANLTGHFNRFKDKLENIRLKFRLDCLEQSAKDTQVGFREFIGDIFEYLKGIMKEPAPHCRYTVVSLGSLATGMVTPYSDIEYTILVDETTAEYKTYLENLSELFELIIIGFGESILYKSENLLRDFRSEQEKFAVGIRIDEHKRPLGINRLFKLINTPQDLLKSIHRDIFHEPGNHTTAALLTMGYLEGDKAFHEQYQRLFTECLQTQEYLDCIKKLLTDAIRSCEGEWLSLDNRRLKREFEGTKEIKGLLIHGIHLARLLAIFLKSCGEKIEPKSNFFENLEELKKGSYIAFPQYQQWKEFVKKCTEIRLTYQIRTGSARASISFSELNGQYGIKKICDALKLICDITKQEIQKARAPRKTQILSKVLDQYRIESRIGEDRLAQASRDDFASAAEPLSTRIEVDFERDTKTSREKLSIAKTATLFVVDPSLKVASPDSEAGSDSIAGFPQNRADLSKKPVTKAVEESVKNGHHCPLLTWPRLESAAPMVEQLNEKDEPAALLRSYVIHNRKLPLLAKCSFSSYLALCHQGKRLTKEGRPQFNNLFFLNDCLKEGDFSYTDFEKTDFSGSKMKGAKFLESNLKKAKVTRCTGLTPEQLSEAYITDIEALSDEEDENDNLSIVQEAQRRRAEYKALHSLAESSSEEAEVSNPLLWILRLQNLNRNPSKTSSASKSPRSVKP